jgi:organic radical activating enzyme
LEFIKRLRPHYDHVEVLLFGGEPTLFHNLQVVVTALRLMSVDIRIHTNFSASLRTYELLSDAGVQIQTTWHSTADPKKFIAKVVQHFTSSVLCNNHKFRLCKLDDW